MGSQLSRDQINAICRRVYKKYPAVDGAKPRVEKRSSRGKETFLLLFKGKVKLDNGKSMPTTVRATADSQGKILKLTTSR